MIIDNIEIEFVKIKLTRPYTIAYKTTSSINNIRLRVCISNGVPRDRHSSVRQPPVILPVADPFEKILAFRQCSKFGFPIKIFLNCSREDFIGARPKLPAIMGP